MTKKMPQSTESHDYDELAYLHLARYFPIRWHKNRPIGTFNGAERGQDWIYEIIDINRNATGAEFCVQNKGTRGANRLNAQYISLPIEVSTLNYLLELDKLVVLHFYYLPTKSGYWMWLDDFVAEHPEKDWQGQESVTVSIPLKNKLNKSAVKAIEQRILQQHHINQLEKRALRFSRSNPNYNLIPSRGNDWISITANPKHSKAFEIDPLGFEMTLDTNARRIFQRATERGETVQFNALAKHFGVLADLHMETEVKEFIFTLIPHPLDMKISVQLRFIGENGLTSFNSEAMELRLIEGGTIYRYWQGKISQAPIVVDYTEEAEQNDKAKFSIALKFDGVGHDAILLNSQIEASNAFNQAIRIEIWEKDELRTAFEKLPIVRTLTPEQTFLRRMIAALAIISSKTSTTIPIPEHFTDLDVSNAENLASAIKTGIASQRFELPYDVLSGRIQVQHLRSMIDNQQNGQGLNLRHPNGKMEAELLGYHIDLGITEYEFRNLRLLEIDDLIKFIENAESDNTAINVYFHINKEQVFIRFLKWLPESEQFTNWIDAHEEG